MYSLAQKIAETRKNIRKKHRALQAMKGEERREFERTFKPIIKPLTDIAKIKEEKIKQDSDEEEEEKDESILPPKHKIKGLTVRHLPPGQYKRRSMDVSSISLKAGRQSKKPRTNFSNRSILQPSIMQSSFSTNYENNKQMEDRENTENESEENNDDDDDDENQFSHQASDPSLNLEDELENAHALTKPWLRELFRGDTDTKFGPYYNNGDLMIGNKKIEFSESGSILIDNEIYPGTEGLYKLIFMKTPNINEATKSDLETYRKIMEQTSLYKKKYVSSAQRVGGNSQKYRFTILPILKSVIDGKGLKFVVTNKKRNYQFWDDPNELCERLKLLVGEKSAGNNIHDAEISSILSELKQKKYIISIRKRGASIQ